MSFEPDTPTVEIHHGRALALSFIGHRTSENNGFLTASSWCARSPRLAYAFATAIRAVLLPAVPYQGLIIILGVDLDWSRCDGGSVQKVDDE
jgi:hypothetical protein